MKHDELIGRKHDILAQLSCIPRKILSIHGRDDIAEFVLRELCHKNCFNFEKAAYFVDNPDFDCLKGIAGYRDEETPTVCDEMWVHPDKFTACLRKAPFNQNVRKTQKCSVHKAKEDNNKLIDRIARDLGMNVASSCTVDTKHGNHGILIFEKKDPNDTVPDEYLPDGVSLLGFCPIY